MRRLHTSHQSSVSGKGRADGFVRVVHGGNDVAATRQIVGDRRECGARHRESRREQHQRETPRRREYAVLSMSTCPCDRCGGHHAAQPSGLQQELSLHNGHVCSWGTARPARRVGHRHHRFPVPGSRLPAVGEAAASGSATSGSHTADARLPPAPNMSIHSGTWAYLDGLISSGRGPRRGESGRSFGPML